MVDCLLRTNCSLCSEIISESDFDTVCLSSTSFFIKLNDNSELKVFQILDELLLSQLILLITCCCSLLLALTF